MGLPAGSLIFAIYAAFVALMYYAGTFCIHASVGYREGNQGGAAAVLEFLGAAAVLCSAVFCLFGPILTIVCMIGDRRLQPGDDMAHMALAITTLALVAGIRRCMAARRHIRQGAASRGRGLYTSGIVCCIVGVVSWIGLFWGFRISTE
jgi:hypothetical protein